MSEPCSLDLNGIDLHIKTSPEHATNSEVDSFGLSADFDANNNELNANSQNFSAYPDSLGLSGASQTSANSLSFNQSKSTSKNPKKTNEGKTSSKSKVTSQSNSDLEYHKVSQENTLNTSEAFQSAKSSNKKQLKQQSSLSLVNNNQKSSNWSKLKSRLVYMHGQIEMFLIIMFSF